MKAKSRFTCWILCSGSGMRSAWCECSERPATASMAQTHASADARCTRSSEVTLYALVMVSLKRFSSRTGNNINVFVLRKAENSLRLIGSAGSDIGRSTEVEAVETAVTLRGLSKTSNFSRNRRSPEPSDIHCRPREDRMPTPLKYQLQPSWHRDKTGGKADRWPEEGMKELLSGLLVVLRGETKES